MPKPTKENSTGGRWTQAEHELFIKGMSIHGRRWTKVADIVGTRTTVQVRSHAQKWEIKSAKDQKPDQLIKNVGDDMGTNNPNALYSNTNSNNHFMNGSGGNNFLDETGSNLLNNNGNVPPPKPPRVGRPTSDMRDLLGDSLKRRASASPPALRFGSNHNQRGPRSKSGADNMLIQSGDQTILREPLTSDWMGQDVGGAILMPDIAPEDMRRPFSFDGDDEDDDEEEEDDDDDESEPKGSLSSNLWELAWDDDGADPPNRIFNSFMPTTSSPQLGSYQGTGFTPGVAPYRNTSPRPSLSRSRSRSSYSSSLGRSGGGGTGGGVGGAGGELNNSNHGSNLSGSSHGRNQGVVGEATAALARLTAANDNGTLPFPGSSQNWRDNEDTDTESQCSDHTGSQFGSLPSLGTLARSRNSSRSENEAGMLTMPVEQLEELYSQFGGQQLDEPEVAPSLDLMDIGHLVDDTEAAAELAAAAAFAADAAEGESMVLSNEKAWPSWEEQAISEEQAAWEGELLQNAATADDSIVEEEAHLKYQQAWHRRHQEQQYQQMHQEQQEHYLRYIQQRAQQLAAQQQKLKEQVKQNNQSLQRLSSTKKKILTTNQLGSNETGGMIDPGSNLSSNSSSVSSSPSSSPRLSVGKGNVLNQGNAVVHSNNSNNSLLSETMITIPAPSSNQTQPLSPTLSAPSSSLSTSTTTTTPSPNSNSTPSQVASDQTSSSISQLLPSSLPAPQPPQTSIPAATNHTWPVPTSTNDAGNPTLNMSPATVAQQQHHHQNVAAVHAMMTGQFPPFGYPPAFAYNPAFQQQLQHQLRQAANARQQMQQQQQQQQQPGNVCVQPQPDFSRLFCAPAPNLGTYQQQSQQQPQQQPQLSQPSNSVVGSDQQNL